MTRSIRITLLLLAASALIAAPAVANGTQESAAPSDSPVRPGTLRPGMESFDDTPAVNITDVSVRHIREHDMLRFDMTVEDNAGGVGPEPVGSLDGAPVLAYVFPTSMSPTSVGFSSVDGVLALAVTSHPDFDDTPLWDENEDGDPGNDGRVYHTHWVVLVEDDRVGGGLSVRGIQDADAATLPPTNPGMPMYFDSPGFSVVASERTISVLVPADRVRHETEFSYDAVTAFMRVNESDEDMPMLGVYRVYEVLSGDLSLPYSVEVK